MPLTPGSRLGPYEITGPLGSGGMGEVFRARDHRLARDVAVKCLPEGAWMEPDRLARFAREAQTLAGLNHPHIAAIYGLEEAPAPTGAHTAQYLILELVEGGTLAERLRRGPLPLREALTIARQIADAMHAAHEQGVIHRDLKPANIALTRAGDAKVLDFGLAKAYTHDADALTAAAAPTEIGTVLGTAAYMSPEQARGLPANRRSDIWAFGCVLYEMLTARQPFRGETVTDTTVAILGRDPDWSLLPSATPQRILWLLRRCLEKDPRRRLHDIADARIELDEAIAHPSDAAEAPGRAATRRLRPREVSAWAIAALLLATATALALVAWRPPAVAVDAPPYRASIVLPDKLQLWRADGTAAGGFAISPDGRRLAIVASEPNGRPLLWVRAMDGTRAQSIPGTENATYPFWSPDSRSIGYLAEVGAFGTQRMLMRVDIDGGQPVKLADAYVNTTATWNRDGVILFTPGGNAPVHRVPASGGSVTPVTTLDAASGDAQHAFPYFLPDGHHFLYSVIGSRSGATVTRGIYVGSLDHKEPPRLLISGALNAKYGNGYVAFMRDTRLLAQAFDPETLQLSGEPEVYSERIELVPGAGGGVGAAFSLSTTGVLLYQPAGGTLSQLAWYDRAGRALGTLGDPGDYAEVALAPDGARAAVSLMDPQVGTRDLWIFDVARGTRDRFTDNPAEDLAPTWSPAGDRIAFSSQRAGGIDLYLKKADGSENERPLPIPELTVGKFAAQWSPDGKFLFFVAGGRIIARSDLWARPFDAHEKAFAVADKPYVETQPRLSPDGRWLAFTMNETGALEVYVTPFPGPGDRQRVSTHGGEHARWSRDGSEIFFLALDGALMSAPVTYDRGAARVGEARPLFRVALRPVVRLDAYPYDVAPDGRRFLMNTVVEQGAPAPLALVVNWTSTLKH